MARTTRLTKHGSAAGAPARGLRARIARRVAVAGICAVVLFGAVINVDADAASPRAERYDEYLVKAAFLYNFARFTEWPSGTYAHPSAPLMICVLGKDPFGPMLDSIAGKRINGRPVAVSRVAGVQEARQCQVLFIDESELRHHARTIRHLAGRPVLTVCNTPNCARFRGMIHLKIVSQKVRFIIDIESAESAGLKFSSKLLTLAEKFTRKTKTQNAQRHADGSAFPGPGTQLSRR